MKSSIIFLFVFLISQFARGQQPAPVNGEVRNVVETLFEGMRTGDSAQVRSTFSASIVMQTVSGREGKVDVRSSDPAGFLKFVGTPHKDRYDERITFDRVQVDGELANVWTSYKFYVGDKFSHCGVNSITLIKEEGNWKILHIIDTCRKDNCP